MKKTNSSRSVSIPNVSMERFQGEYQIVLEPSLPPIVDSTRRVTISLKDDIKKERDKKCHYGEDRKKWIDTMVQQLCLPSQTEQKVEAPPERQRPQCSYSDWTSCCSHPRRDPTKSEGCKSIFYKGEKMRIPKRGPGKRVYYPHYIWEIQVQAQALKPQNASRGLPY